MKQGVIKNIQTFAVSNYYEFFGGKVVYSSFWFVSTVITLGKKNMELNT